MKNIVSISIMIISIFGAWAQEKDNFQRNTNNHEFRLDALALIVIPTVNVEYEYVIGKYSGAGLALNFSLDDVYSESEKFSVMPYYRQYFFNKKDFGARGFFVEGLLKFTGGDGFKNVITSSFDDNGVRQFTTTAQEQKSWFATGVGLSLGQKWVSNNGFVLEISVGGGRYFGGSEIPEFFVRGGIAIGYRFF